MSGPERGRFPCPACVALIHPDAILCPICHQDTTAVPGALAPEAARARVWLEEFTRAAGDPPEQEPVRVDRIRPSVLITAGLLIPTIGTMIVGRAGVMALGFLATFGVVVTLIYLVQKRPPLYEYLPRETPEQAVRLYFFALVTHRWQEAWSALSPFARGRQVTTPPLHEIGLRSAVFTLDGPEALARVWAAMRDAVWRPPRIMNGFEVEPAVQLAPNVFTCRVRFSFENEARIGPLVIAHSLAQQKCITVDLVVAKHRSQYWLLTGELFPRLDRTLRLTAPVE